MPISTFWNQVRLLTPNLEPLITLPADEFDRVVLWPFGWTHDWAPAALFPDVAVLLETPPLSLVRNPLPYRLSALAGPSLPGTLILGPTATDPAIPLDADDRLWAACLEVLAGSGHRKVILGGDGWWVGEGEAPAVATLADHINWTQGNYLEGYPVEADTPSRFIDTQTLYTPLPGLPLVLALCAHAPAFHTPAEWGLARKLGAEVITEDVALLALLAHFKGLQVTGVLRIAPGHGRGPAHADPAPFRAALAATSRVNQT